MELRPLPFIGCSRYLIDRAGRVYTTRPSKRRGKPPEVKLVTPMTRQEAEDATEKDHHPLRPRVGNRRRDSQRWRRRCGDRVRRTLRGLCCHARELLNCLYRISRGI